MIERINTFLRCASYILLANEKHFKRLTFPLNSFQKNHQQLINYKNLLEVKSDVVFSQLFDCISKLYEMSYCLFNREWKHCIKNLNYVYDHLATNSSEIVKYIDMEESNTFLSSLQSEILKNALLESLEQGKFDKRLFSSKIDIKDQILKDNKVLQRIVKDSPFIPILCETEKLEEILSIIDEFHNDKKKKYMLSQIK